MATIKEISRTKIKKTASLSQLESFQYLKKTINHIIFFPQPFIVPVYKFNDLGFYNGSYNYSYTMEKLHPLTGNEKYQVDGLDLFDVKRLKKMNKFLLTIENIYHDLHCGNVMKDDEGEYRLVDLEGFVAYPYKKYFWEAI